MDDFLGYIEYGSKLLHDNNLKIAERLDASKYKKLDFRKIIIGNDKTRCIIEKIKEQCDYKQSNSKDSGLIKLISKLDIPDELKAGLERILLTPHVSKGFSVAIFCELIILSSEEIKVANENVDHLFHEKSLTNLIEKSNEILSALLRDAKKIERRGVTHWSSALRRLKLSYKHMIDSDNSTVISVSKNSMTPWQNAFFHNSNGIAAGESNIDESKLNKINWREYDRNNIVIRMRLRKNRRLKNHLNKKEREYLVLQSIRVDEIEGIALMYDDDLYIIEVGCSTWRVLKGEDATEEFKSWGGIPPDTLKTNDSFW
ncbi:hypothetical protein [Lelliottia wanjuensis]|uniref:hypothetical protein n=1 Tax=Lelliottia wanjuensis TaxID=3050585 RepID=UPI00254A495D|nr:hypothetical protein [Lelliottia sp. V104_15]MDK9605810.1 hypothetical protein [Lelliottia sp. V104_15]